MSSSIHLPKEVAETLGGISGTLSQFTNSLFNGAKELVEEVSTCLQGLPEVTRVAGESDGRLGRRAGPQKAAVHVLHAHWHAPDMHVHARMPGCTCGG